MAKNLIIYYSRKGENYWNGNIKNLAKGNTEIVAEFIRKAIGGDLFRIETVKEYAADYYACTNEAKKNCTNRQDRNLKNTLTALQIMTTSLSADRVGGELSRWQCSLSLKS